MRWPSSLQDLLISILFLIFEDANDGVYQTAPTTRDDMMDRIRKACCAVTQQLLQGVMQNFKRRLTLCLENEGELFEHLLPKTRNNG